MISLFLIEYGSVNLINTQEKITDSHFWIFLGI